MRIKGKESKHAVVEKAVEDAELDSCSALPLCKLLLSEFLFLKL